MSLNILLINPILSKTDFESPLGLLYISKVCRMAGYKTKVIDLSFEYDLNHLKTYIKFNKFDIAGIYSMSSMIQNAFTAAEIIKNKYPDTKIIFGGPHPTLLPEEVLSNKNVDFVVMGEGERTILELLKCIREERYSYVDIKGIGFKKGESIIINERREWIDNLDVLPFPDRTQLDTLEGYINLAGIKVIFGYRTLNIIASRGCHFNCAFCQPALRKILGEKVRYRSVDNVIDEIEYMQKEYKINALWFEDDTFTYNRDWVLEFCDKLQNKKNKIVWSCNSRLDVVDEEMLKAMKRAGCIQIRYGLESGSQQVLDNDFKKGTNLLKIKEIFNLTHNIGIDTYAYVMLGGRYETSGSIEETERFLNTITPTHIQLAITTPLPGTYLKQTMELDKDVTVLSNRVVNWYNGCNFNTQHLKARDLELIYRNMFNKFHFFKFRSLMNKKIIHWIKMNLDFMIFLVRSKKCNRYAFIYSLFLSYATLMMRLIMLHTPFFKNMDREVFKSRLSFPFLP